MLHACHAMLIAATAHCVSMSVRAGRDDHSARRLLRQRSAPGLRQTLKRHVSKESVTSMWFRSNKHGHNLVMPEQMTEVIAQHAPELREQAEHEVKVLGP